MVTQGRSIEKWEIRKCANMIRWETWNVSEDYLVLTARMREAKCVVCNCV